MIILFYLFTGFYFFFLFFIISGLIKQKRKIIPDQSKVIKVSVVVAARNEESNIQNLIDDFLKQTYPKNKLEIIFSNDCSTDRTGRILDEAAKNNTFIHHINIQTRSKDMTPKKYALEKAIQSATGDIIVTTDADCRVPEEWISSMASMVDSKGGIVIGFSKVLGKSFFHKYQMIDFLSITAANAGFGGWNIFWSGSGQNLAYKKESFKKIGGFKPVKNRLSGDDMYLVQSISKLDGATINTDPKSFVKTKPVKSILEFINQRSRWSSNARINLFKEPRFFCFLSSAFLCNLSLLMSFFIYKVEFFVIFLLKFIFEGVVILLGGKVFSVVFHPMVFSLWSLLQPIYIPFIGLIGLVNLYSWKKE